MNIRTFLSLALLLGGSAAAADDVSNREKLIGEWHATPDAGDKSWHFSHQGDALKVAQIENGASVADFVCGTDGKPCEIRIEGKKASVSFWYNGAKLVELETRGADVVERRFAVAAAGDGLEVEVVPMVPAGKNETLKFKRAVLAAAKQ